MMDEFEKYINENRAEFDQHKADRSKMWAAIESELDASKPKVIPLWRSRKWRIAAAVIAVFGLFAALTLINRPDSFSGEDQIVSKELLEIDMYYQNLVSAQVQLVQNHPQLSVEDKEEFLAFMDELDEEYEILKLEMSKNLDNERVLEAIVSNYKKRIELIENLLRQINESKKSNDEDVYIL
ncbi:hypothetical protein [Poritiphilus flavus]|uniref:Anti-sigma factor n=1 Tax=Poritiphilus flavus TaxID=2697053 RepID=A0A6L9EGB8_9FLAO|nr:hypothetical protein [Poritiphilus flavus]NAS13568.1 hypothetical protein [Poritiphilus flavus]